MRLRRQSPEEVSFLFRPTRVVVMLVLGAGIPADLDTRFVVWRTLSRLTEEEADLDRLLRLWEGDTEFAQATIGRSGDFGVAAGIVVRQWLEDTVGQSADPYRRFFLLTGSIDASKPGAPSLQIDFAVAALVMGRDRE